MTLKYFKHSEFDSPDLVGSGEKMDAAFLELLDKAREIAGIPFKINSGYRTKVYNLSLAKRGYQADRRSAHLKGKAADISATTTEQKRIILKALYEVGFRRFGIMGTAIHVDNDATKPTPAVWRYSATNVKEWELFGSIAKIKDI